MKMLHQLTLVICLLFTLPNLHAADKIEEGFGLRLGNFFEPGTAVSTNLPNYNPDLPPRGLEYEVINTNDIKPFDNLFVQITPKTHKIYRIIARGDSVTEQQKKDVMSDFQRKFPADKRVTRHLSFRAIKTVIDGKIIGPTATTEVVYTALDLEAIAREEKAEQKSPK